MTSTRRRQVVASLREKEDRDAFVEEQINVGLPFQIRALRRARGWSQAELGERSGMAQETISQLESLSYGRYTLRTLKRLASAFDIGLVVRFAPFSELVDWEVDLSPDDLTVPSFDTDPQLVERSEPTTAIAVPLSEGKTESAVRLPDTMTYWHPVPAGFQSTGPVIGWTLPVGIDPRPLYDKGSSTGGMTLLEVKQ